MAHTVIGQLVVKAALASVMAGVLSACGSTGPATPAAPAASSSGSTVHVGTTSVGEVVVDAAGMTLYLTTRDTKDSGKSTCVGECATLWPALLTDGAPTADGVSGTLATIDTASGQKQVTLDGWPLYHYAKDKAAGDVTGQGVGGVWWVLTKDAQPVKTTPDPGRGGY